MPACHAGGRGFESRPFRIKVPKKLGTFLFSFDLTFKDFFGNPISGVGKFSLADSFSLKNSIGDKDLSLYLFFKNLRKWS